MVNLLVYGEYQVKQALSGLCNDQVKDVVARKCCGIFYLVREGGLDVAADFDGVW